MIVVRDVLSRAYFRALLLAFPADVRRDFGDDVEETFRHMLRRRTGRGPTARVRFCIMASWDVVREGVAERRRRSGTGGWGMRITNLMDDMKLAFRSLARAPLGAAVLILTLGGGIGAETAVFSVLHGVLLRPLPHPDPHELVAVRHELTNAPGLGRQGIPGPDLLDYRAGAGSLASSGSISTLETNLQDDQGAARITIGWVTPGFFETLEPTTSYGRLLDPGDWTPRTREQMEDPTFRPPPMPVLLSHGLWRDRFASDPDIVGRSVAINGTPMNVVGVLEPGFRVHAPADAPIPPRIDVFSYLPIPMTEGARGTGAGVTLARLRDGASLEQARIELEAVTGTLVETWERHARLGTRVVVEPLLQGVVGEVAPVLWVLFGAMAVLLTMTVMNVAGLQLVRAGARTSEFAIRLALGSGSGRIVQQLLAESAVLAALGALVGVSLAGGGIHLLVALAPADIPRLDAIRLDGAVLLFTLVISAGAAVLFGLAPALASRRVRADALTSARSGRGRGAASTRGALIVAQVALSVVLLAGSGLLLRSFSALSRVDPGYDPGSAVAVELALPFFPYREIEARRAFFDELLGRTRAIPGVTVAGLSGALPLTPRGGTWTGPFGPPGSDLSADDAPRARYRIASPGFLEALGARLDQGRTFADLDATREAESTVLVDRRLAEATWPGAPPVDRHLAVSVAAYIGQGRETTARVVGVVDPIRYESLRMPDEAVIWIPFHEYAPLEATLVLRGRDDPATTAAEVRAIVAELDPGAPVFDVRRLEEDLRAATARERYASTLLALFAGAALALAAVGLFGVVTTSVQQRTRELGLRVAVGAPGTRIAGLVLLQGARLAAIGLVAGTAATVWAGPLLDSLLFQVDAVDPSTLAATALVLGLVTMLAALVPAVRAARMNPVDALRSE